MQPQITTDIHAQISSRIEVYRSISQKTHQVDEDTAKRIVAAELETFLTRLSLYMDDPKNKDATITVAQGSNIFLEVIQAGLSFSSIANHVYISRLKGTGMTIGYQVTAHGLIYQAQRAGAINHASEAVIVQIGEQFSIINTPDGKHIAQHTMIFDNKPKFTFDRFLVGYVYITYPDGSRELHWIAAERMKEFRQKSLNAALYNDESFIQTKIIKHALRTVRKTPFMQQMQADDDEVIQQHRIYEEQPQPSPFPIQGTNGTGATPPQHPAFTSPQVAAQWGAPPAITNTIQSVSVPNEPF